MNTWILILALGSIILLLMIVSFAALVYASRVDDEQRFPRKDK